MYSSIENIETIVPHYQHTHSSHNYYYYNLYVELLQWSSALFCSIPPFLPPSLRG